MGQHASRHVAMLQLVERRLVMLRLDGLDTVSGVEVLTAWEAAASVS